ncbi:DUF952 domain-containing protein [Hyphococcus sp.]|uniref:DUF952 domain-containing protein n=1 Tax=Hyphococcus sp. TaxID=2038636 RepID=UPI00208C6DC6|nr:MAG: hypothetical protein DHS20C04_28560 [Marinicaulis sp.]
MSDKPHPDFVYRLVSSAEWRIAQHSGVIPLRDIDERDGYIHLSTREQVLETAKLHFSGADDLIAIQIPLSLLGDDIKFELAPKRGDQFPHFYGALKKHHVSAVLPLIRTGDEFAFGAPQ